MWWRAGPYLIEPNSISVSGVSSGAAMVRSGFPTNRIGQTTFLRVTHCMDGWRWCTNRRFSCTWPTRKPSSAWAPLRADPTSVRAPPPPCLRKPQHSPRTHDARNTRHDTTRCDGQSCAGGDVHGHAQPDQVPAIAAPIPQWSGGESLTHSPPPPRRRRRCAASNRCGRPPRHLR